VATGEPPFRGRRACGIAAGVPRLFVPSARITDDRARLARAEVRHLRALRLRPGDALTLFDDRGREYEAVLGRVGARGAEAEIRAVRTPAAPPAERPIILIAGTLKGQRMDLLVEKATELGVARIVPALTARTVARPAGARERSARWRRLAVGAATQCGRAALPEVATPLPFAAALHTLPADALRILFWEEERTVTLHALHAAHPAPLALALAIGPEGGFAATEVALARGVGFAVSGLGPRTLRAETAGIVAVALVQALWGDLGGSGSHLVSPGPFA
jgi:16S rRNA (uracil1498-N3)-methyltransferase